MGARSGESSHHELRPELARGDPRGGPRGPIHRPHHLPGAGHSGEEGRRRSSTRGRPAAPTPPPPATSTPPRRTTTGTWTRLRSAAAASATFAAASTCSGGCWRRTTSSTSPSRGPHFPLPTEPVLPSEISEFTFPEFDCCKTNSEWEEKKAELGPEGGAGVQEVAGGAQDPPAPPRPDQVKGQARTTTDKHFRDFFRFSSGILPFLVFSRFYCKSCPSVRHALLFEIIDPSQVFIAKLLHFATEED